MPYIHALVAAVLLMGPGLLNRAPIYYEDTQIYLGRPAAVLHQISGERIGSEWVDAKKAAKWERSRAPVEVRPWAAGRSPYWGAVAYAFVLLLGGWGIVAMNALATGTVLSIAWNRMFDGLPSTLFFILVLGLAIATPLGLIVAFTMPDILAGLLILSVSMLAIGWQRLRRIDRVVLTCIAIFSAVSHDSHLLIAVLMTPVAALIAWKSGSIPDGSKSGWSAALLAPIVLGILAALAFSMVAKAFTGNPPLRLPHLTAQITSLPSGQRFLREHCRVERFVICDYASKLPVHWIRFLFDKQPESGIYGAATLAEQKRLSEEQYGFAAAVAREYPVHLAANLARQWARQVKTFDLADLDQRDKANYLRLHYPPEIRKQIYGSRLWLNYRILPALQRMNLAATVIGSALILLLFMLHLNRTIIVPDRVILFAVLVLGGMLANDFVCGVLASPLGRFQTRIIWIVPFLAVTITAFATLRGPVFKRGVIYVPSN